MEIPIGILASATFLPPTQKSIEAVFQDEQLPEDTLAADIDFQRDIGIEQIYVADTLSATDLCIGAARQAIAQAGISPDEIDLLIDFTSIPEAFIAPTWSAAGAVQEAIGAQNAYATAINTGGCCSYHVALRTACALLRAHPAHTTALLFAGDKTPALNHTYYPITVTCDGGSAVLLRKNHQQQVILSVETATVGKLHDIWYIPGLGHHKAGTPLTEELLYMTSNLPRFNAEVIPINLFMFRKVMRGALKKAGLTTADIDYYIYPTFSRWDQQSFCAGFRIPPDKIYTEGLAIHGHLQENDMVINYDEAVAKGFIQPGDLVMETTNGAGFTWSAALIRH